MCLLVKQPAGTVFTDAFLAGVYAHNSHGLGVMYVEAGQIHVRKTLCPNFTVFKNFYTSNISGRECAWHARLQTHGLIDLINCHPYEVLDKNAKIPMWLMHNGILHTGNKANTALSDTWHYINDFIRPILSKHPELLSETAFVNLIAEHISDNRFVLLDANGNYTVINEGQGVTYNGAWLSNTYAWDTTGTEHDFRSSFANIYSRQSYFDAVDDPYEHYPNVRITDPYIIDVENKYEWVCVAECMSSYKIPVKTLEAFYDEQIHAHGNDDYLQRLIYVLDVKDLINAVKQSPINQPKKIISRNKYTSKLFR